MLKLGLTTGGREKLIAIAEKVVGFRHEMEEIDRRIKAPVWWFRKDKVLKALKSRRLELEFKEMKYFQAMIEMSRNIFSEVYEDPEELNIYLEGKMNFFTKEIESLIDSVILIHSLGESRNTLGLIQKERILDGIEELVYLLRRQKGVG